MLTSRKIYKQDLMPDTLERLYQEAYPYTSAERQRLGEEFFRNDLTNNFGNYPIVEYSVDGYIVGIYSYTQIMYNGKMYLLHRFPIYGQTPTGSRAWWYSEDHQRESSIFIRNEGYSGIITMFNPDSPAGQAVGTHFGSFDKYYQRPIIKEPHDVGIKLTDPNSIIKVYIINLMDLET